MKRQSPFAASSSSEKRARTRATDINTDVFLVDLENTVASMAQASSRQAFMERPHWDSMRRQVAGLALTTPHGARWISDDAVSITPTMFRSTIQDRAITMEPPRLPTVTSNAFYSQRAQTTELYHQIPTAIFSINAERIVFPQGANPFPPHPKSSRPPPPSYRVSDAANPLRRSPFPWLLRRPWEPFMAASLAPRISVIPSNEVAWKGPSQWRIIPPSIDRLIGPGSVLKEVEARCLPFLRALTPLRIFGTWFDNRGPDASNLLRVAEKFSSRDEWLHRLCADFISCESAQEEVGELNDAILSLEALDQYAVRVALDGCALLGGVELSVWPSSPMFTGAWLEEGVLNHDSSPRYISQCRARDGERWGVPFWLEAVKPQHKRLEVSRSALPTGVESAERSHQRYLQSIPNPSITPVYVPSSYQAMERWSGELPTPETWAQVKSSITKLLITSGNQLLSFEEFNNEMKRLLGRIWSGARYEPHHHANRSTNWLKERSGAQECLHKGVIYAALEIPTTWSDPHRAVADPDGITGLSLAGDAEVEAPEAAVPEDVWYKVEVKGYQVDPRNVEEADRLYQSFDDEAGRLSRTYAALGYRRITSPQQPKDDDGCAVRRSLYQVELLYKSKRWHEHVCQQLRSEWPLLGKTASTVPLPDYGYDQVQLFHMKVDPRYANALYEAPRSLATQARLIELAPRYDVPPALATIPAERRGIQAAAYLRRLVQFSLFEYDGEFPLPGYDPASADAQFIALAESQSTGLLGTGEAHPPPTASSSSSSSPSSTTATTAAAQPRPPRVSLPTAELTLSELREMAFSPPRHSEGTLTPHEIERLQRLYLCLSAGAQRAPFSALLFPIPGSPYRRLLATVASWVRQSFLQGNAGFNYSMGPDNTCAGVWDEKLILTKDKRVRIVMDPSLEFQWDNLRDGARAAAYVAHSIRLQAPTQNQRQRRKTKRREQREE